MNLFNHLKQISLFTLIIVLTLLSLNIPAQQKLTIKDFTEKSVLSPKSIYGINWMKDSKYYTSLKGNKIIKFGIKEMKEVSTILDGNKILDSKRIQGYSFVDNENKLLLQYDKEYIYRRSYTAKYYLYTINTKETVKISDFPHQSYATLSPDGKKIGFTYENNLYYVKINKPNKAIQVTKDGKINSIINGSSDWVYEEEFSITRAFDWSSDSRTLAFLRFDESKVKEYNMQKWPKNDNYPENYIYKYPKAGEKNAAVTLHLYDLDTKKQTNISIKDDKLVYIPRLKWTPKAEILSIIALNRLQNHLEIIHVNRNTNAAKPIITLKEDTYVDLFDPVYVDDKSFILMQEQTGYKHLYLYNYGGKKIRAITKGNWEVSSYLGISPKKTIYYSSKEDDIKGSQLYSISIKGTRKTKITNAKGIHSINMSPDTNYFIDYYTSKDVPLEIYLYDTKNIKKPYLLEDNKAFKTSIEKYNLPKKEFFTIELSNKTVLNAYMIKPTDFDKNKQYPLMIYQYSGPRSQNVQNGFRENGFHYMLTQEGYIVAFIDPRGTGGRGKKFAAQTYGQLGKLEAEDLIESAKIMGKKTFIDSSRIGIWGWSYGGYMSSLATFKGGKTFKAAIAVAPVTNWRYYDTIYTERYLKTPQLNPSGYDDNSPVFHADKLDANYLLIHGTGDDNVHFQNAIMLEKALVEANKQFQSFYYTDLAHSLNGKNSRTHLYTMMLNFVRNNL